MAISARGIQKIGLALSIVIVLNLFINYAVYTFYKPPLFDTYCANIGTQSYPTPPACEAVGGRWENGAYNGPYPKAIAPPTEPAVPAAYCNATFSCSKLFDTSNNVYQRNVFIVLIVVGLAAIIGSLSLVDVGAVASGILFGGVVSLFIGAVRYWSNMDEQLRVVILGLTLATLIWIGYRKLADREHAKPIVTS